LRIKEQEKRLILHEHDDDEHDDDDDDDDEFRHCSPFRVISTSINEPRNQDNV